MSSELAYAGDLTPTEAWALLSGDRKARLVDVRTKAEWSYVGVPELGAAAAPLFLEWQIWPDMAVNADFVPALDAALAAAGLDRDDPVVFLCRSGVRSAAAARALTAAGWRRAYNLSGGFEGPPDDDCHRGGVAGWKASGLPWTQT
jgi:rhodanese-related sulfurtransferase